MVITSPVLCRRFIGRDQELNTILERFREAADGRGSVIVISGEAGIGKTRLLSEVAPKLETAGAKFIASRFFEHASTPMGLLVDITASVGEIDLNKPFFEDRADQFSSIVRTLQRFSAAMPLVIAVEDAQWGDPASLECLHYIASRIEESRLLLIVTYRSEALDQRLSFMPAFLKLARQANAWEIALEPLPLVEMRVFVRETLPEDYALGDLRVAEILELAEGNPLFAEELLKHSVEFGKSRRLPSSIRAAVLERLRPLGDGGRLILSHGAVIGRQFEPEFLATLTGDPLERIVGVLRLARNLQLVVEHAGKTTTYAFRHALIRETLYEELLADEARVLHRRVAEELERLPDGEERTIQLAYHYWAARDPVRSVTYNVAAAAIADTRFAYEDAARHAERVLEFASEGTLEQAEARHRLAARLSTLGETTRADELELLALEWFERHGDCERVADIAFRLGTLRWNSGSSFDAITWYERAAVAAEGDPDNPRRTHYFSTLAKAHASLGSLERCQEYVAISEKYLPSALPIFVADHFDTKVLVATELGDFDEARAAYRRFLDICRRCDHTNVEYLMMTVANNLMAFGDLEVVKELLDRALELETSVLHPGTAYFTQLRITHLLSLSMLEGRYSDAQQLLGRVPELQWGNKSLSAQAVLLATRTGRHEIIEGLVPDDLVSGAYQDAAYDSIATCSGAVAEWHAANGRLSRAHEIVATAAKSLSSVATTPWSAVGLAMYGTPSDGTRIRELLAKWAAPPSNRVGRAYLALVDALRPGAEPGSVAFVRQAAKIFEAAGLPYYEAIARELDGGKDEALEIYRRIGAQRDARRLEDELDPANRRGRRSTELTTRERELAALIAQGKSNRAIAEELVLSERTVEAHVASILDKLNIGSRVGIAERIDQQRKRV